ncbi:MAG: aldo/keto reductase [bacterium]|nr:aldo/keto reductase [bacterium]
MAKQLYQPRTIPGRATPEGTRNYFDELAATHPEYQAEHWFRRLPEPLSWHVSRLGFGTYRIARGHRPFFDALREALISGTNVIDTAANYADGESEGLVGDVLSEVLGGGRVLREQLVLIGKAGYIQGRNLELYERNRKRYTEAVWLHPKLLHCIQPEFLIDQIDFSRRRLGVETIDVFLLHSPEYYLKRCEADGVAHAEAHQEFHRRLARAFECLEGLVERGQIAAYGLSSNSLAAPSEQYTAVDLGRILEYAPPNFRVLQFPANLAENDFRYSRLAGGGILASVAEKAGLWTLANRPLNSMPPGRGLLRIARNPNPPPDDGASAIAEFNRMADRLVETEEQVTRIFAPRHFIFDQRTPAPSGLVYHYKNAFTHRESFRENRVALTREVQRTINYLKALAETDEESFAIESLVRLTNGVFGLWERYVDMRYHYRLSHLEECLARSSPALDGRPLAQQAVLFLLGAAVPTTVLVGMRQPAYVRQMHEIYGLPAPPNTDLLGIVTAAETAFDEI